MTLTEFSDEFDIQYNSIAGANSPGIDMYEKSVYLTKAQLELIKNYYDPKSNRKQDGFEKTEKRRSDLKNLIKRSEITTFTDAVYGKSAVLPNDLFLIIREDSLINVDNCGSKLAEVKPITYDEFNIQRKNPYRTPDKNTVWKLDIPNGVELISKYPLNVYIVDYIKYPKPIILVDLSTEFPGENLTIDGISTISNCELSKSMHAEILDRAVELALRDYKPQDLETKIALDQRNE